MTAASLLHSSKVDPAELDGSRAWTWERRVKASIGEDVREFCVVPFFLGPTLAIEDYLVRRLGALRDRFGPIHMERTPFLFVEPEGESQDLVSILEERILECAAKHRLELAKARIVLVDHGSPVARVAKVRDVVANSIGERLAGQVERVEPASMESREGEEYAFNRPLLAEKLQEIESGPVMVVLFFLSPGRHAGEGGDIARICAEAEAKCPGLRCYRTELVGTHPKIVDLLERRMQLQRTVL